MLLASITFLFPSCNGGTNDPDEYPEGVITVKMRNYFNGGTSINLESGPSSTDEPFTAYLKIGGDNNFYITGSYTNDCKICDTGKKSLGAVKTIPTIGWASEVAVIPQHTYVIKIGGDHFHGYNSDNNHEYKYYKLYVIDYTLDTTGGIIGAEVQYCEWNPEK